MIQILLQTPMVDDNTTTIISYHQICWHQRFEKIKTSQVSGNKALNPVLSNPEGEMWDPNKENASDDNWWIDFYFHMFLALIAFYIIILWFD